MCRATGLWIQLIHDTLRCCDQLEFGENAVLWDGEGVARNLRSVQQSSQLAVEKGICPLVGKRCRGGIVMRATMPREGMILTRIAEDRRHWFLSKCRLDLSLRSL